MSENTPDEDTTNEATPGEVEVDARGVVTPPNVAGLPDGYTYGVTRYADVILQQAFPTAWRALVRALEDFKIELSELQTGGGGRTVHVARFDDSVHARGWAKRNIELAKTIDGQQVYTVRGHEIDMFTLGEDGEYPGAAVEMEWNNKDPFFDRDLINFQALHREGVLAAGVIVTRGDRLQALLKDAIMHEDLKSKYGESSTHWRKLVPRVMLGGGGECPLLLVGIEPERLADLPTLKIAAAAVREARHALDGGAYRAMGKTHAQAKAELRAARAAAVARIPPIKRARRGTSVEE